MVSHANAVVTPYYGCAASAATYRNPAAPFTVLLGVPTLGSEPVEGPRGGCK